ncbi:MAG: hypothetical protein GY917_28765, partial [Planctomycetaceae bacterium]|nr:hypothetical protein [Planctomycetaceae bacterium]
QLYVDGQLNAEMSYSPGPATTDSSMLIGKELHSNHPDGSGQRFFQGEVDDVRIYDRPLSASEVAKLYNESLGILQFTPLPDQNGSTTITVTVEDGGLDNNLDTLEGNGTFSRTFQVDVTPVNDLPIAGDATYRPLDNTRLDKNQVTGLATLVTDIDEDALTFSVVAGPSDGQLVLNEDGSFHYTPSSNFNRNDFFTYVANDGTVDSNIGTVTLKIDTDYTWYNCREP